MYSNQKSFWLVLLASCLLLASCRSNSAEASPTSRPETVLTAAAATANARLTEIARPTATSTHTPLPTIPTITAPVGTATPTFPVGFTPTTGTPVAPGGVDRADYFADITVPDGTDFRPNDAFVKTWRLKNTGTSTWTTDFALAFFGGAQMGGPADVPLAANVAPGEMVDVSVNLVAPADNGTYRGFWKMRNATGAMFDFAIYVEIDVAGGLPGPTTTPPVGLTPGGPTPANPTPTSKPAGSARVTDVSLAVNDASPADCPHTFTFTASFTLNQPARVTYRLEAGTTTPGFEFNLPGPQSVDFDSGDRSVAYTIDVTSTVDGWAQFHVTSPNDVVSNQVSFSLNCSP